MTDILPWGAWHAILPAWMRIIHYPLPGWQVPAVPEYPPNPCSYAVFVLVDAVNAGQVAASLPEGPLRAKLEGSARETIDRVIDEFCGTRPPWPGPPPAGVLIASQLAAIASLVQASEVSAELLRIAGRAVERSEREESAS